VSQPLLIVNADDYGLTEGVSLGILRAHRDGIVTSTSALAVAPAFTVTAGWLADHPNLGVGAHLAAAGEDPPLLTAAEVPTLVDRRGRFRLSWRQLLPHLAAGRVDPADVEREFGAQLGLLAEHGIRPTHLDTHQHLHLWPPIGRVVIELARRHGVGAVRVPRSRKRTPTGLTVRRLGHRLAGGVATAGLRAPQDFAGLDEGGAMVSARLERVLARLGGERPDTAEVALHPGEAHDPARSRYRWGYRWGDELAASTAPWARHAIEAAGFRLGSYADLVESVDGPAG
jgi:predicted glycoside hydrolase/deacetylase ChbG (UPF0249 family)